MHTALQGINLSGKCQPSMPCVNSGPIKKLEHKILRVALICGAFLGLVGAAAAQDAPRVEIFGGYSYGNVQTFPPSRSSSNGWNAAATVNLYRWFGLTTDFGGLYGVSGTRTITIGSITQTETVNEHLHSFLFGPQISWRRRNFTSFAHLLLGETRTGGTEKIVDSLGNTFTLMFRGSASTLGAGGGVDFRLSDRIAWRAEADYLSLAATNDVRVSTGIVFRLGKQK